MFKNKNKINTIYLVVKISDYLEKGVKSEGNVKTLGIFKDKELAYETANKIIEQMYRIFNTTDNTIYVLPIETDLI